LLRELSLLSIVGVVFFAVGAYLPAKPLSDLIGISTGSLIFPGGAGREVRLVFSIPEARIMQGEYREALELFQAMITMDPNRLEVYIRIMKLAAVKMNQPEIVQETFRTGLKNLKDLRDRKTLAALYEELMSHCRDHLRDQPSPSTSRFQSLSSPGSSKNTR
jgi:tetratricopeptide (TPR) repeat protein